MTTRLLVATRKGLFDIQKQAGKWRIVNRSFLGEPVSMVLHDTDDGALYAALSLGHFGAKLHRSDDDGRSWLEVSAPSYDSCPKPKEGEAPSLKLIWALEVADGILWAGTIPGGLFKSSDKGQSWSLIESLWNDPSRNQWFGGGYDEPGVHSICIDPRNNHHLRVAVSCGGVWVSEDQGLTWTVSTTGMWADYMPPEQKNNSAIQDPHRMVQCQAAPDCLWVQHHNGIFRSTDGGKNWGEIKAPPSSFGFAVAVHPQQPNTAWFVPAIKDDKRYPVDASLLVNRTDDGGKTFTELTKGLPKGANCESYDLIYRHGLTIDKTGEYLAMGSTTGNLWISENGGANWESISCHLPPVYVTKFV